MLMQASHLSATNCKPASSAFWCPLLQESFSPQNALSSWQSCDMMSQVRSVLPSSIRRMKLSLEIFPASASDFILSRMMAELFSSTASSLKHGTMTDSVFISDAKIQYFEDYTILKLIMYDNVCIWNGICSILMGYYIKNC